MSVYSSGDKSITVREMVYSDIDEVEKLYKSVAITKDNYKNKLLEGERSFDKKGGMFFINDRDKLKQLIDSDNDVILVACDNGRCVGVTWYILPDGKVLYQDTMYKEGLEYYKSLIAEAAAENNIIPAGEGIIDEAYRSNVLIYIMFHEMMSDLVRRGIIHQVGEVYYIKGFDDEEGYHESGLLNNASYHMLLKTGGEYIGDAPMRKQAMDGYTAYICPRVFYWNNKKSMNITRDIYESKGWHKHSEK